MIKERKILNRLIREKDKRKHTIIVGARQVGKTTLLKLIYHRLCRDESHKGLFLDLDLYSNYEMISSFERAINTFKLHGYTGHTGEPFFVFLDEFQRYSDLSIILKNIYDHHPDIKIYASGSSSLTIKNRIQESLAGRKILHILYPLSFEEFIIFKEDEEAHNMLKNVSRIKGKDLHKTISRLLDYLYEFMIYGGYPEVCLQSNIDEKREVLKSIFDLYVKKDLVEYLNIHRVREVKEMLSYLAINNGQKIKYEELASITGFSIKTVKNYLEILKETFLIIQLKPFFTNKTKELVKIPKIYFIDNGVANYFTNNFTPVNLRRDSGSLFEGFIIGELLKHGTNSDEIKYWQDKNKNEVDIVVDRVSSITAIEVKFKNTLKMRDMTGINSFKKFYPGSVRTIVSLSEQKTGDPIRILPFSLMEKIQ